MTAYALRTSARRTSATETFRVGATRRVLREILRPGIDVAVWTRDLPAEIQPTLAAWTRGERTPFERTVPLVGHASEIAAGLPANVRRWLAADVALLTAEVARITGAASGRVFFGVVRDDQCRKFHVDYVSSRLITTYAGPGTEWVPSDRVDRSALARQFASPDVANRAIVPDPRAIRRAVAGEVVMLKGARYPGVGSAGAVHRSPPVERTDDRRIVLVVTVGGAFAS